MTKTALAFEDDENPEESQVYLRLSPFYGITVNNSYYVTATTTHTSNVVFSNIIIDSGNKNVV